MEKEFYGIIVKKKKEEKKENPSPFSLASSRNAAVPLHANQCSNNICSMLYLYVCITSNNDKKKFLLGYVVGCIPHVKVLTAQLNALFFPPLCFNDIRIHTKKKKTCEENLIETQIIFWGGNIFPVPL